MGERVEAGVGNGSAAQAVPTATANTVKTMARVQCCLSLVGRTVGYGIVRFSNHYLLVAWFAT